MTSVTIDSSSANVLSAAGLLVEVHDKAGQLIGYFAPLAQNRQDANAAAKLARQVYGLPDPETIPGRDVIPERTYTTAEVKAYLKSLESKG